MGLQLQNNHQAAEIFRLLQPIALRVMREPQAWSNRSDAAAMMLSSPEFREARDLMRGVLIFVVFQGSRTGLFTSECVFIPELCDE